MLPSTVGFTPASQVFAAVLAAKPASLCSAPADPELCLRGPDVLPGLPPGALSTCCDPPGGIQQLKVALRTKVPLGNIFLGTKVMVLELAHAWGSAREGSPRLVSAQGC